MDLKIQKKTWFKLNFNLNKLSWEIDYTRIVIIANESNHPLYLYL